MATSDNQGRQLDYRLTRYSDRYRIGERKDALAKTLADSHPKAENMYEVIRRDWHHKTRLAEAYNRRCAYCGVPIECIGLQSFQIDHIVSVNAVDEGRATVVEGVHSVENLALSCQSCNRRKNAFAFDDACHRELSPDRDLGSTFVRDDDYRIVVSPECSNSAAVEFYELMHFSDELHRVDYVLATLLDMREYLKANPGIRNAELLITQVSAAIGELLPKRNACSLDLADMKD